jgi:hypothetical protein
MAIREILVPMLSERFADRGLQLGSAPDPIAVFPAAHPEVGAASVSEGSGFGADVAVGDVARDHFFNPYEEERATPAAAEGIARNVLRFLEELFADRLLMWRSTDGRTKDGVSVARPAIPHRWWWTIARTTRTSGRVRLAFGRRRRRSSPEGGFSTTANTRSWSSA